MRQFYLENEYGQKYDLNNVSTGFLSNPSGLGYSMESSYTKLGATWTRDRFTDSQQKISGEVVFGTASPYDAAAAFFAWIRRAKTIVLHRITTAGEWLRDVDLVSVGVTEIGEGDLLTVPVEFVCKSLWYSKDSRRYVIGSGYSGRKTRYDYRTAARFKDSLEGRVELNNDGSIDAPFTVEMEGPIVNPVMSLVQDDETLYSVSITGQASAGEKLRYSSIDNDLYVEKVGTGGVITNLVGDLSISNTNFFKVPIGTSYLVVTSISPITQPINITVYKQYRVV